MAKADRLERLDARRAELEAEYLEAMVAALRQTAGGAWGLFDHQQDRKTRARIAPVIENLSEIALAIDGLRAQLIMEQFDLHREFMAARGPVSSSAVGEPKQAQAWLDKLDMSASAKLG